MKGRWMIWISGAVVLAGTTLAQTGCGTMNRSVSTRDDGSYASPATIDHSDRPPSPSPAEAP